MKLAGHILSSIRQVLKSVAPDATAILYGSQARGDARPDSDVDILVLLPDEYHGSEFVKRKLDISGRLYDLSLSLGIGISPLILVPKVFFARETPFSRNVMNEGIPL